MTMRKLILYSILALMMSSCGYEIRKKPELPKPKLTKEQIRKQEYEQKLESCEVEFLFECDGVRVYRFVDYGSRYYFTSTGGIAN